MEVQVGEETPEARSKTTRIEKERKREQERLSIEREINRRTDGWYSRYNNKREIKYKPRNQREPQEHGERP